MDHEPLRWITEHLGEEVMGVIGGFIAFFLHEIHHKMFRRPARFLIRLLFRRHG